MATLQELEKAIRISHGRGDLDSARRLSSAYKAAKLRMANDPTTGIPGMEDANLPETNAAPVDPTLMEQATGVGEAALTVGTAATGGAAGMVGSTLMGIAEEMIAGTFGSNDAADRIERKATESMQKYTYTPRTETGRDYVETVGEAAQHLAPLGGLATELSAVGSAVRATDIARPAARAAGAAVRKPIDKARKTLEELSPGRDTPDAGPNRSAGSAGVDPGVVRAGLAEELPIPIKLTEGQKSRDFNQQRFERETAKIEGAGNPLRERFDDQNLQLQRNLDEFIDSTGAQISDVRGIGEIVDGALRSRAKVDKDKIRAKYKEAEKAGEMSAPVDVNPVVTFLRDNSAAESTAPVITAARKELVRLGAITEEPDGSLAVVGPLPLNKAEQLRKFVNKVSGSDPTNIKFASDLKSVIDDATEGLGGSLYKEARALRTQYGKDYENVGLVKRLLNTKRGTDDRAIAMEDVLRKSILDPSTSADMVTHLRRLLTDDGSPGGAQAWSELRGGTIRHIRDEALKSVTTDQNGNRILSASALDRVVTQLDKSGKLDLVLGKREADQIRLINDVAKDVMTSPPGSINHSNTASVLAGMIDITVSGAAGVPAPIATSINVLTKHIKNAKLKARVQKALGE